MKRQNPLTAPAGVILTIILFVLVGSSLWFRGGNAFSPGKLSSMQLSTSTKQGYESHAVFEAQCELCHAPLKATQAQLCLECHQDVRQQMSTAQGTHSLIEDPNRCARCHPDHRGRDFDLLHSAFVLFDHSRTRFDLIRHQVDYNVEPIECIACHATETDFAVSDSSCENCHGSQEPDFILQHIREYSRRCSVCHDGTDRMTRLDHQDTSFPLTGKHLQASCVGCHRIDEGLNLQGMSGPSRGGTLLMTQPPNPKRGGSDPFMSTPTECAHCHDEPLVHQGFYSSGCDTCHTPEGWIPAMVEGHLFDHTEATGFSLAQHGFDYENQPLNCRACHTGDMNVFDLQTCIICHASDEQRANFLKVHREQFGDACLECHDGVDRMINFDHAGFFPLDGRHAELECSQCHLDKRYVGTPVECAQCHAEPAIHSGFFGLQCQYCHLAQGWAPAQLIAHRFPLDHGEQGEIACQVCHPGSYMDFTCYGCHDHQPDMIAISHLKIDISGEKLVDCVACHAVGTIEPSD